MDLKNQSIRRENEGEKSPAAFLVPVSHPFLSPAAFKSALRFCDTPLSSNNQVRA